MDREFEEQNRKRAQARGAVADAGIEPGQASRSAVLSRRSTAVASGLVQRKADADAATEAPPMVTASPGGQPIVQFKCAKCAAEDEEKKRKLDDLEGGSMQIQRAADPAAPDGEEQQQQGQQQIPPEVQELLQLKRAQGSGGRTESVPDVASYLQSSRGGGSALSQEVREDLEPRFGADFGDVRVHTDSTANQVSRALGAHAFAYGRDLYFASGQYNPGSASGRWLLAHELTHTIQQTGGRPRKVQAHLAVGHVNDPYEQEADRMADRVTSMSTPKPEVARHPDGSAESSTPEVMHAMMLQRHASSLLDEVGLSAPESIQGHLFGGECIAEYWNLAAAIASLVAAAGAGLALILAPDPTTITKWAAIGAIAGIIAGLAWCINAIISLVNCKRALGESAERDAEIRRLQQRQAEMERLLRQLQGQGNQPPQGQQPPQPQPH